MIETVRNAWRPLRLRKEDHVHHLCAADLPPGFRRAGAYIDSTTLETYLAAQSGTILGLMNAMSGSAFSMAPVFALSIQPYINASLSSSC